MEIKFDSRLWQWRGKGSWYFITIPVEFTAEIATIGASHKKGFGSVKVHVTIGASTWQTSVFPDTKTKSYELPIKKEIRTRESLKDGDNTAVSITILEA